MKIKDWPEEKRLKHNQYYRNYYHKKKAEKHAAAEKLLKEQNLKLGEN